MTVEKKTYKVPEMMFTHVPKTAGTFVYEIIKHVKKADNWLQGSPIEDGQRPGRRLAFSHLVPCDLVGNKNVGNGFVWEVPQEELDKIDVDDWKQVDKLMLDQLWEPDWKIYSPKLKELNLTPMKPIFGFQACHANHFREAKMSFGTVRNPFSALVSYYHCAAIRPKGAGWHFTNTLYNFRTFEQFVVAYCTDGQSWFCPSFKNNYYFQYKDYQGLWTVDYLIRQENLRDGLVDLGFSANKISGYRKNLKSEHNETYKGYYTPKLRKIVEKKMAYELKTFGYNFNGPTDDRTLIEIKRGTNEQP